MALDITPAVLAYVPPDPPLEQFEPARDRAFFADPTKASLLSQASSIEALTPYIGTELKGVQVSQLTDAQKDELALLVAERGVVFFRDQDITLEQQHALAAHYGKQDRDPSQQDPRHVTILGHDFNIRAKDRNVAAYHGDHSFEVNPPSYTLLRMLRTPETGGDTIFTSQVALFDKLSPTFQKAFEGFFGIHSSEKYYLNSINGGGKPRRAPIITEHPLVRTHPVTHLKSLNYNPLFVTGVKGLNDRESFHTLNFLYDHLHSADDLTVRWKWTPDSIAFWDNRVVVHRAVPGGYEPSSREGKRTAIFGERPFFDPSISESWSERKERLKKEKLSIESNSEYAVKTNGHLENGTRLDEPELNFSKLNVV
ncbi:TauD-domain-containing protein [Mollisia scopiformis]|uniref:TauD-domain-containing protein n=1 Tax=Mollisia scopiformis TaxID=149040 RepID=A0A194XD16_MOLSC|nr:TauD-domain-containing protein [Mollisia scopiformis]KUJ17647.1 TauD-domain-containing protein [Mollisia scopiformis]